MIEYFKTRRGWKVETEKRLKKQRLVDGEYYAEIMKQRVGMAEDAVAVELCAEIDMLEQKIKDKNAEIAGMKKKDHEIEIFKNELSVKTQHLDFQTGVIKEMMSRMAVQVGHNDTLFRDSDKLLLKEV